MKNLMPILLLIFILVFISNLKSQTLFNKKYGTDHFDNSVSITQTNDAGYAVTGMTTGNGAGGDIFLMKLNTQGTIEWTKNIFGVNADHSFDLYQIGSNYFIGGQTYSYGLGCISAIAIMLDSSGNVIWSKTYGDIDCNVIKRFSKTIDGFIACGAPTGNSTPGWLFKTNGNGDLQWSKSYSSSTFSSVKQTNDGGFIAVNYWSGINILKVDSGGNPLWYKSYLGSTGNTQSYDMVALGDGSTVISGEVYYNACGAEPDIYLLKIDQNGDRVWFKTYGSTFMEYGTSLARTPEGGFIVAGRTNSFGHGDFDAFLLKTDQNGDLLWAKTYGDVWYDEAMKVVTLRDSGFVFTGNTFCNSGNTDSSNIYVVRTDKNGISSCNYMDWFPLQQNQMYSPTTLTITATNVCTSSVCNPTNYNMFFTTGNICLITGNAALEKTNLTVYPNPASDNIYLTFDKEIINGELKLFNMLGEQVFSAYVNGRQETIDCNLDPGIYFLKVTDGKETWMQKIIKQ